MVKGVFHFKYENKKTNAEVTSWAGLPVYPDLARVIWIRKSIGNHLNRFSELCSEIWNCGISGCRKKRRDIETFFFATTIKSRKGGHGRAFYICYNSIKTFQQPLFSDIEKHRPLLLRLPDFL